MKVVSTALVIMFWAYTPHHQHHPGTALTAHRQAWNFLSAGQSCQDLLPTQTHRPHKPLHMAVPTLPGAGPEPKSAGPERETESEGDTETEGERRRKRKTTSSSRSLFSASHHLSKRCIHYPSYTLGTVHGLFTKCGVWQSLFKHCS